GGGQGGRRVGPKAAVGAGDGGETGPFTQCPECPLKVRPGRWNSSLLEVTCTCGATFCRRCRSRQPHEPVPCVEAVQWAEGVEAVGVLLSGPGMDVNAVGWGLAREEAEHLIERVWDRARPPEDPEGMAANPNASAVGAAAAINIGNNISSSNRDNNIDNGDGDGDGDGGDGDGGDGDDDYDIGDNNVEEEEEEE
ncbi:unnamed protein product, partial [Discosporangium mesarthrocarpum]